MSRNDRDERPGGKKVLHAEHGPGRSGHRGNPLLPQTMRWRSRTAEAVGYKAGHGDDLDRVGAPCGGDGLSFFDTRSSYEIVYASVELGGGRVAARDHL
jgi:hypothetical protein